VQKLAIAILLVFFVFFSTAKTTSAVAVAMCGFSQRMFSPETYDIFFSRKTLPLR